MKKAGTFYLIAKGGYLKKPIIEKFEITPQEVKDIKEQGETDQDAIDYILSEKAADYAQGWSATVIFTEKEFNVFKKQLAKF
jgi:hypothetical protein